MKLKEVIRLFLLFHEEIKALIPGKIDDLIIELLVKAIEELKLDK